MADDVTGAVRRTRRPYPSTEDRQTPETAAPACPGATNTASTSVDTGEAVSSRVSSQDDSGRGWTLGDGDRDPWTDPVGTVREHDDGTTAVKVAMGNDTGKGQHVWCEMTPQLGVRWLAHDEVAEWATEREARLAELRATIAADPDALFQLGHVHDTSNDMQAFLELPDCEACGGTGKDDHATPFEAPLAVHFAGPPVKAEGRRRQLCMWCGHVLRDVPSTPDAPPPWPDGALVQVEDGLGEVVPYEPGDELPPGCCALPDDEYDRADDGLCEKCVAPAVNDPEGLGFCRQHLTDHYAAEADAERQAEEDLDDGPDEAQETRAADWPAEPEDGDRG